MKMKSGFFLGARAGIAMTTAVFSLAIMSFKFSWLAVIATGLSVFVSVINILNGRELPE